MFTVLPLLLLTRHFAQIANLMQHDICSIYHLSIKCQMKPVVLSDILQLLMSIDSFSQKSKFFQPSQVNSSVIL